ncbi:MAG: hypothetical protein M1826_001549 [Phylliscum demangeonii]|nr:MAG: hypothetical protein M1826_001549 [Phylliscum demangeonii]
MAASVRAASGEKSAGSDDPSSKMPPGSSSPPAPLGKIAAITSLTGVSALISGWMSRGGRSSPYLPRDGGRFNPRPAVPLAPNGVGVDNPAPVSKNPYNPHDLVASRTPGRGPQLPYSAAPAELREVLGDSVAWTKAQNVAHIISRMRTYDGAPPAITRWRECMNRETPGVWDVEKYLKEVYSWTQMHSLKITEDDCVQRTNREIEQEARAAQKSTEAAGADIAAQHNPYGLVTGKTPRRAPRLPFEQRPASFQGDERRYIRHENEEEIVAKLLTYDGLRPTASWARFDACMRTDDPFFHVAFYTQEQLQPHEMERARDFEDYCVETVNRKIQDEAGRRQKTAYFRRRAYPPPRHRPSQGQRQRQSQSQPRNDFSAVAAWAHRVGRYVTTESHRLHLSALPLQRLMRQSPRVRVPAWEAELAH